MQAIIGYVLGIVTVILLRRAAMPTKPSATVKHVDDKNEQLWRETLNFLTYDGNEQEEQNNG